jgi:phosphatidylinositol alpha-mannosyltransferase
LVPRKGCQVLLSAINHVIKNGTKNIKVTICGKGQLLESLKKFVNDNNLDNVVEFKGYISEDDKPKYYKSADLAVFPSSGGESFGIVLLEAMASGNTAVLAGDNPGYRSVLGPKPELLFDPHNDKLLAEKIEQFIQDSDYRKSIIAWQNDYVKSFDVNAVGSKLESMYYQLLQNN